MKPFGARLLLLAPRAFVLGLGGVIGCQESEGIREYAAPKDAVAKMAPAAKAGPTRILAAIIPRQDATWFVKLMGPVAQLEKQGDVFQKLVQSFKFEKPEAPTFETPTGWTPGEPNSQRFATLKLPAELGALEATIIKLGPQAGSNLDNINRWRGQVGLSPVDEKELATTTKEIEVAGSKVIVLDVTGPGGGKSGPMGMMPNMNAPKQGPRAEAPPRGPGAGSGPGAGNRSEGAPEIKLVIPQGWKEMPPKPLSVKTYQAAGGQAEITIIPLAGPAGGNGANINRWRGQVGLPPVDPAKAEADGQTIDTPSGKALVVDFAGTGNGARRITAGIVTKGSQTWFIKMMGPADATAKEKDALISLIRSLQLPE